jgi:beta-phosphoglucomutase-like phosphatase (HAD superfamily)
MRDEIVPLLPAVPGVDPGAYRRTLAERFSEPRDPRRARSPVPARLDEDAVVSAALPARGRPSRRRSPSHDGRARRGGRPPSAGRHADPRPAPRRRRGALAPRCALEPAAVSSSALTRLDACFAATGLDALLPADRRFSAEGSLPQPTGKPDPAVYALAGSQLGVAPEGGLAIEDSLPGAQSAIAAGFATIGNVQFVAADERAARVDELRANGVCAVVDSWRGVERRLA